MKLNRDDLQKGKYYCGYWNDGYEGKVIVKLENPSLHYDNYHVNKHGDFEKSSCLTGHNIDFREATSQEIFWLDQCILTGKGIKFEDLILVENNEVLYEVY